jgi:hypothetical protein
MGKHEHLFRTPAEHERIAALEANDTLAPPGRANHQAIDSLLLDAGAPGTLADAETLCSGQTTERLGVNERVVQNEIGLFDTPQRAKRP